MKLPEWFNEYEQPLNLVLKPSRRLAWLVHFFHFSAITITIQTPITIALQVWILLLILVSWRIAWLHYFSVSNPHFVARLSRKKDGSLAIESGDGVKHAVEIRQGYCLYRWWIFLPLKLDDGACRTCLILPDSLDAESFRRIYRALRLQIFIGRRYF